MTENTGKGPAQKPSASRKPSASSGLQTIESSPIKPSQLSNGSIGTGKGNFKGPALDGKTNFNKPFSSGQFKGAAKDTFSSDFHHDHHGHHGHHGDSFCDDDFNWSISIGFGFGGYWGSSFWYGDSWCYPYYGHHHWSHWDHCHPHYPVYYYPYYYPYYYSYSYYPVYSDPVYYAAEETYTPAPAPYEEKAAPVSVDPWELLNGGNAREARRLFARQIDQHPNDGLPQIGYAIASTLIDRKLEAISMMRRALKNDAEAIVEIPQAQGVMTAIDDALNEYIAMSDRRADSVDAQFMIAAMRFMLGDTSRAFYAIDRAADWGDKDASAANLHAIIRKAMEQPAAPAPTAPPAESSPTGQPVYMPPVNAPVEPPPAEPEKSPWDIPF